MIKSLFSIVFLLLSFILTISAQNERTGTNQWKHVDGATELSVTTRDKVRFNEDYTDVLSIDGDGFLEVLERRNGFTRVLKIMTGANGQLIRNYSVNGEQRSYDAEGKSWFAKTLAELVSKGLDARARANQMIRQRGVAAVLNEIPRLTGVHTKRVYLEEAAKSGNLNSGQLREVFGLVERDISSDYEKATFLINTVGTSPINRNTLDAYSGTIESIKSNYERARVLKAILKANPENREILMLTLASAAKISSDYEKANVLIQALRVSDRSEGKGTSIDRNTLDDYFTAVGTIKSDYEHARVLKTILKANPGNREILMLMLASTPKISSDYEKANVLIQVAQTKIQDESIRTALFNAVKTITSEHERGRVLNVVYRNELK